MDSPFVFTRDIPRNANGSLRCQIHLHLSLSAVMSNETEVTPLIAYSSHRSRYENLKQCAKNRQPASNTMAYGYGLWPLLRRGTVMSMDGFFRYATDFPNTHLIGNSPSLSSATCRFRNPDPAWLPRKRERHSTALATRPFLRTKLLSEEMFS